MNAYELSEKKNKMLCNINYLRQEMAGNNTDTVLLTNEEVMYIVESLEECVGFINDRLKAVKVP